MKKKIKYRMENKMRKSVLFFAVLVLSLAFAGTGFAFSKNEEGKTPQITAEQPKQTEQSVQPTPEEMEKMRRKAMEDAKKIVVAIVNGANITKNSLTNTMAMIAAGKELNNPTPSDLDPAKKEALDRLITQELAYQKAKAEGLQVDVSNIDNAIANIKVNLGSEKNYSIFLERRMTTEDELRAEIERNLLLEKIFAKEVTGKVTIPEDEVKKEYEKQKDKYFKTEKVVVIDVIFLLKTDDKESMSKAEAILKKIQEDKNKDPWKLVLDGTFIVRKFEVKKDKQKELYDEAKKLKENELSGIIKTSNSLHILKLKEYSPERQLTLDEVRGGIEDQLRMAAQEKRMKEFETELRKNAKIEIIETERSKQKTEDTKNKDKESTQKSEDKKQ